jgi:hypothetical protein
MTDPQTGVPESRPDHAVQLTETILELADAASDVVETSEDGNLPEAIRWLGDALLAFNAAYPPHSNDDPAPACGTTAVVGQKGTTTAARRFQTALAIVDPGASNPSGIAHAIIEACREARDAGVATREDPAIRLMVTQLAWVCRADHDTDDYGDLLAECRRRAASGSASQ